ncbi:hypothetical protein [Paracoccus mutanolyticus]|nr:hypothetical protein [Paracoccus mutanolyticus]
MTGNGAQSEFQALAMRAICGIDRLRFTTSIRRDGDNWWALSGHGSI